MISEQLTGFFRSAGLASGVRLGIQKLGRLDEELDSPAVEAKLVELTEELRDPLGDGASLDWPFRDNKDNMDELSVHNKVNS